MIINYELTIENFGDHSRVSLTDNERKIVAVGSGSNTSEAFNDAYDLISK